MSSMLHVSIWWYCRCTTGISDSKNVWSYCFARIVLFLYVLVDPCCLPELRDMQCSTHLLGKFGPFVLCWSLVSLPFVLRWWRQTIQLIYGQFVVCVDVGQCDFLQIWTFVVCSLVSCLQKYHHKNMIRFHWKTSFSPLWLLPYLGFSVLATAVKFSRWACIRQLEVALWATPGMLVMASDSTWQYPQKDEQGLHEWPA